MAENLLSHRASHQLHPIRSVAAAKEDNKTLHHQGNSTLGATRNDVNINDHLPRNSSSLNVKFLNNSGGLAYNRDPKVSSINNHLPIRSPKGYISVRASELEIDLKKRGQDHPPPQVQSSSTDQGAFYQLLSKYAPLFMAALKGDWKAAESFFANHPQAIGEPITETMETVLHIAAGTQHTKFVEQLAKRMDIDQLRRRNWGGDTALCFAASSGVTNIAKAIINRDQELRATSIKGEDRLPCKELDSSLYIATTRGHKEMVRYLYHKTKESILFYNKNRNEESWYQVDYTKLFVAALTSGLYDFGKELLERHPDIAKHQLQLLQDLDMAELVQDQPFGLRSVGIRKGMNETTAFQVFANKPKAYYSGTRLNGFQRLLYHCLPGNANEGFLNPARQSFGDKFCEALLYLVPCQKSIRDEKKMHAVVIELLEDLTKRTLSSHNVVVGSCIPVLFQLLFQAAEFGIVEFFSWRRNLF